MVIIHISGPLAVGIAWFVWGAASRLKAREQRALIQYGASGEAAPGNAFGQRRAVVLPECNAKFSHLGWQERLEQHACNAHRFSALRQDAAQLISARWVLR